MLEDAERLIAAWNERQAKRMPMIFSPTIGAAIAPGFWFNLMDALRQSVKVENSGSTARRKISGSSEGRTAKKPSRSASKQRKTG